MKIAQITDCHLYAERHKTGYNDINPFNSLQQVLQKVKQDMPDLILFTGDISGDASHQSYLHFVMLCEQELDDTEWYWIPGNHDDPVILNSLLPDNNLLSRTPISTDHWLIHGLSSHYEKTLGKVDEVCMESLLVRVDEAIDKHHMIAVHHHPIPVEGWMDKHELLNRDEFVQHLSQRSKVSLVIYGHIHTERQHKIAGTTYLACPSSCWQWRCSNAFGWTDDAPGYRLLTLDAEGLFHTQIKRI